LGGAGTEMPRRSDVCFLAARGGALAATGPSSSSLGTVMSKGFRGAAGGRSSTALLGPLSDEGSALRARPVGDGASACATDRADVRVLRRRSRARVVSAISPNEAVLRAASRSIMRSSVRSRSLCRPVPPALVVAKRLASSSITAFSKTYPRVTWATHTTHSSTPPARRTLAAELRNRLPDSTLSGTSRSPGPAIFRAPRGPIASEGRRHWAFGLEMPRTDPWHLSSPPA
jgi:hypothetical protein